MPLARTPPMIMTQRMSSSCRRSSVTTPRQLRSAFVGNSHWRICHGLRERRDNVNRTHSFQLAPFRGARLHGRTAGRRGWLRLAHAWLQCAACHVRL